MRSALFALALLAPAAALSGCATTPPVEKLGLQTPRLVLEEYLVGRTYATGIFEDRSGVATRALYVTIDGTWDPATQSLRLDERFIYADGERSQRIWTFRKTAQDRYVGTAGDVIGSADVVQTGAGAFFGYQVDLKLPSGSVTRVNFSDRLYLLEGGLMINRATVKKYGITGGEVTIVFMKTKPEGFPES